ncbi:acyltransferase [bacterium]|nr:acyltransferase [bacterium]
MRIGIVQFAPEFGDKEYNLGTISAVLNKAEADLVVLPELCTTGYQFKDMEEVRALCEPVPGGESVRVFERVCRERNLFIVAGIGELAEEICYNASVLVGPEGHVGTYRKVHLFDEEKDWFRPGTQGFPVWDIGPVKIGMMVCFDWIFPESVRSLALAGADLICHPANLVLPYCPDAMITRSIENRVFTATANRTGREARGGKEPLTFIGRSQITDPKGNRLAVFGAEEEGLKIAEIDVPQARNKRITKRNDLWEDRRPDQYHA